MTQKSFNESIWQNVGDWENTGGAYRHKEPEKECLEFIDFLKKNNITGTVLDIGCGGGRNSIAFAKAGFKVTGIDFSESAIKLAKTLAQENNLTSDQIDFKVIDILEEDTVEFDIAIDFGCLHHIKPSDWEKYSKHFHFKKAYMLQCLSVNSEQVRKFKPTPEKNYYEEGGNYTHFFKEDELITLFGEHADIKEIERGKNKKFWILKVIK